MQKSWERLTWHDWDFLTWEQWGRLLLYEVDELDRGPITATCNAMTDRDVLKEHTGWFWNTAAPVASLYGALRDALCSYADKLLEDLCIAAKAQTIQRTEFYYRRRKLLLLLDASKTSWDLADWGIIDIAQICNRENTDDSGAVVLLPGAFTLAGRVLRFAADISQDARFNKITDGGVTYIVCWAVEPVVVDYAICHSFGAALVANDVPTRPVRDMIKRLWDGLLGGFSAWHYFAIDAASRNLPLAEHDGERVIDIFMGDGGNIIVTDRDRYLLRGYSPGVDIDDVLQAGQPLVAGHRYFDFHNGEAPEDVTYVIVPGEALQYVSPVEFRETEGTEARLLENGNLRFTEDEGHYSTSKWTEPPGDLMLVNAPVPITVDHDNKTVSWPVSAAPNVNAWFWSAVRLREVKYGVLLYDLLREEYGTIPNTINPLAFFARYILRGGVFVITLPPQLLGGGRFEPLDMVAPAGVYILYGSTQPIYTHFRRCNDNATGYYAAGAYLGGVYEDGSSGDCYEVVGCNDMPGATSISPTGPFPSCDACRGTIFRKCGEPNTRFWAYGTYNSSRVYRHTSGNCLEVVGPGREGTHISATFVGDYDSCSACDTSPFTHFRKCGEQNIAYWAVGKIGSVGQVRSDPNGVCYQIADYGTGQPGTQITVTNEVFTTCSECQNKYTYFKKCGEQNIAYYANGNLGNVGQARSNPAGVCFEIAGHGGAPRGTPITTTGDVFDSCNACLFGYAYLMKCGQSTVGHYAVGNYEYYQVYADTTFGECYTVVGYGGAPQGTLVTLYHAPYGTCESCQYAYTYLSRCDTGGEYYASGQLTSGAHADESGNCYEVRGYGGAPKGTSISPAQAYSDCDTCQRYYAYFRKCSDQSTGYYASSGPSYTSGYVYRESEECYEVIGHGNQPQTTQISPDSGTVYYSCSDCMYPE